MCVEPVDPLVQRVDQASRLHVVERRDRGGPVVVAGQQIHGDRGVLRVEQFQQRPQLARDEVALDMHCVVQLDRVRQQVAADDRRTRAGRHGEVEQRTVGLNVAVQVGGIHKAHNHLMAVGTSVDIIAWDGPACREGAFDTAHRIRARRILP